LARKLVIDLMHASVPLVVVRRTMKLERLVTARALQAARPGWSAIIAKAFCVVARDEPWLRTFYLKWPWPHFYEVPCVDGSPVGKGFLHVAALVGAAMCSACLRGSHDRWP